MTSMTTFNLWPDLARQNIFNAWIRSFADAEGLVLSGLRIASADASFRRYLRVDTITGESRIIMDAPPIHEDTRPFIHVANVLCAAGLPVPRIFQADSENGFLLLSDVGNTTLLEALNLDDFSQGSHWYAEATDLLITMQSASTPGVLPLYDAALLRKELELFPDWYIKTHRKIELSPDERRVLDSAFDTIIKRNLAAPQVYVHRDFMPRNLMMPLDKDARSGLSVLDFQDAVFGPITYDIACLMRDAFHSWDEEAILDITIRYWEKAKKAGLMDFEDWHSDFGAFYRAVEWMALQRHLKVAGIFARLTLRDNKAKYLADAPRFMGYIRKTCARYRELGSLLRLIDKVEGAAPQEAFSFGRIA